MSQAAPYDPPPPPRRLFSTDDNANNAPLTFQPQPQQQYDHDSDADTFGPGPDHTTQYHNTSNHSYNDSMTDFQHQQPYRDDYVTGGSSSLGLHQRNASGATAASASRALQGVGAGGAGKDDFDPFQPPPKSTGDLRMWRHENHGNMWFRGGRGRCIGRFCCCTIMTVVLLLVSVVLTLAVFLRPPDIEFSGIQPAETGSTVELELPNLTVNLGIGISVRNPNYFSVTFKSIKATVNYPIGNTEIGGGEQDNVVFKSNSKTTFTFPFKFQYSQAADPDQAIIRDIFTRCGFMEGGAKTPISLKYTLQLAIQILFVTISPPIEGTASFDCPFSQSDVQPLIDSILGSGGGGTGGT